MDKNDIECLGGKASTQMIVPLRGSRYIIIIFSEESLEKEDPCHEAKVALERMEWLRKRGLWESVLVVLYRMNVAQFKKARDKSPYGHYLKGLTA